MRPVLSAMRRRPGRKGAVRTVAIVPAAGSGKRLGLRTKKPFVMLKGKPLVAYALQALQSASAIDAILIAAERSSVRRFERLIRAYGLTKVIGIVIGGATRFESVKNCLERVDGSFDIVLIHDGARPFIERVLIERSVLAAKEDGACVVAVAETDTVKRAGRDMVIRETLRRDELFRAQTPQAFRRELIQAAYSRARAATVTDDASLVERLCKKVRIVRGSYRNMKITTQEDLQLAEVLL